MGKNDQDNEKVKAGPLLLRPLRCGTPCLESPLVTKCFLLSTLCVGFEQCLTDIGGYISKNHLILISC